MSRIEEAFSQIIKNNSKALIPFITAGYPRISLTLPLLFALEEAGANLIEVGFPFSDPIADGPTIQKSSQKALENGLKLKQLFELSSLFKKESDTPLILLTYFNPVFHYGSKSFLKKAKDFGFDGIIIPDLPPEEAEDLIEYSEKIDFSMIFLVAPNTPIDRIKLIADSSSGFIYCVSMTGVTGSKIKAMERVEKTVKNIKKVTQKPVAVGFGISKSEHVKDILNAGADGVVVGSAIVKLIEKFGRYAGDEIERKCRELRRGLIL